MADLEDAIAAQFRPKFDRDERIISIVRGGGDDVVKGAMVEAVIGVFRQDFAEKCLMPIQPRAAQASPIRVCDQNADAHIAQRFGQSKRPRVRADDHHAVASACAEAQQFRQRTDTEARKQDGRADQSKSEGDKQRALNKTQRLQLGGKEARHGHGDNPARCDQADQQRFFPRQAGTNGGEHDRDWADEDHHSQHKGPNPQTLSGEEG